MLFASSLRRGDIVLAAFPFADLSSTKRRPAVIIATDATFGEFTLAFVTSRHTGFVSTEEVAISPTHPEFSLTGLSTASRVRAGKLATLAPSLLTRRLGRLGPLLTEDLDHALIDALTIDRVPIQIESRLQERERLASVYKSGGASALLAALGLPPANP